MPSQISRLKAAELLSIVGAGVVGAGLALIWALELQDHVVPLLIVGASAHAFGMYTKHRLEAAIQLPTWSTALYWVCWVAIVGLIAYAAIR